MLLRLFASLLLLVFSTASLAEDKVFKFASIYWAPYSGKDLKNNGASIDIIRQAAKVMGYDITVEFLSWEDAVEGARSGKYDGYLPEYLSLDLTKEFDISRPIGDSPLGLAQRADAPIQWKELTDLIPLKIGVVKGYINTAKFDKMVADGTLKVIESDTDDENIQKVARGEIDAAVVDQRVLEYTIKRDGIKNVNFNSVPLEMKRIHVAFSRTPSGTKARGIINTGLARVDIAAITKEHL